MPLDEVELIYDAEAREVLPAPFACEDAPVLADSGGSFDLEVEVNCENGTSVRFPPQHDSAFLSESRIIDITQPTTFSLFAEGGEVDQVLIGGCQSAPGDRVDQLGDVPNDTVEEPAGRYVAYRVWLVTLHEPVNMRLRMTPK
jgi:hypothetical protein